MPFAQLVVGPPGAGKSTYCNGMHQFMSAIGRKCSVVNLDPANDQTSYPCAIDVRSLVTLEEIMSSDELGPNGGVLYALEELEHNVEWLTEGLKKLGEDYVLFDCPGQVELFTHHDSLRKIVFAIQNLGYRVCSSHISSVLVCRLTVLARSSPPDRFLRADTSVPVHLHPTSLIADDVANGSHTH
jgi:GTPase SAR1 family protein